MEVNNICPVCGGDLEFWNYRSPRETYRCVKCHYNEIRINGVKPEAPKKNSFLSQILNVQDDEEPQEEPEKNFFAECSTAESLAWQYIGWTASIINNQTRLPEQTTIADLKEALEHFKRRWEELLNETK